MSQHHGVWDDCFTLTVCETPDGQWAVFFGTDPLPSVTQPKLKQALEVAAFQYLLRTGRSPL